MPLEARLHCRVLRELEPGLRWWGTTVQTNLWIGGRGCVTGLHNDDEDNFLVQCFGSKRVVLFPPEAGENLYVNDKYDSGTRCCDVNVFDVDEARFPRFFQAKGKEVIDLSPGDVLFIPAFWWHAVITTSDTSISLNSFVSRPKEQLTRGVVRYLRHFLHLHAGYRRGNCVCHANESEKSLEMGSSSTRAP